jgi:hypothetical protein
MVMNEHTARRRAIIGSEYLICLMAVDPELPPEEQNEFKQACAMAASYAHLDLRDITPEELIEPMIRELTKWQRSGLVKAQSAIDRLLGLYGMCAVCGELAIRDVGGRNVTPDMRYAETGDHVCHGCDLQIRVTEERKLLKAA